MSVNEKMTAIADEIRTLSGTTGVMGLDAMADKLDDVNAEIETQESLISQIASALEGKAAGGDGGSSTQTAQVYVDTTSSDGSNYYSILKYIGENGLETFSNSSGYITMVVPSICYVYQSNTHRNYYLNTNNAISGNAEMIWPDVYSISVYVYGEANLDMHVICNEQGGSSGGGGN